MSPDSAIRHCQIHRFSAIHATEVDRHEHCRRLIIGDVARSVTPDEEADFTLGQRLTVALFSLSDQSFA